MSLDERADWTWPAQPDAVLLIDLEQGRVSRTRSAGPRRNHSAALGLQP